jgi:hypothetical protein
MYYLATTAKATDGMFRNTIGYKGKEGDTNFFPSTSS